ncbi:DUF3239 domain-containing protein [Hymenobacter cellulosivorans]|uniref:DUF3239 domain-containing protein n=1 Tax=Hymenobacter cellulosivorans TaxID=2932249 RepID=A0ABY4FEL5_9BACT|nr:DUF3239 domain-containing protein [Hymenobacter cellulosivorans]UOQ54990.1 DUF3239 domain-containing protein [Hymenobacter cellulosivorans]
MERAIGDPGEFLNNSVASRAVNIEPDMRLVRRYDIYHHRYRSLLQGWGSAGLALLALGIGLCWWQHPVWGGILIVLSLPVLFIASRLPQTLKGDAYRNGLLIPGIITNLNPLTLTCVADVRPGGEDDEEPGTIVWGVKEVIIKELPGQAAELGMQAPCVSLFGDTDEEHRFYTNFEPRPLAWGTKEAGIIEQARRVIDDEEWLLLPVLARAYAAAEKNDEGIAYFDAELTPVSLPKAEATEPAS